MTKTQRKWTLGHYHWVSEGLDWYVGQHKESTPYQRAHKCMELLYQYDADLATAVQDECKDIESIAKWFDHIGIYLGGNV